MNYQEIMNAVQVFTVVFSLAIIVLVYVLTSLGYMKCMEKAGEEKWKAWVPFYNDIVMYEIVGLSPYLTVFSIVKSILTVIVAVATIGTLGSMGEDLDDTYGNMMEKANTGYYNNHQFDDSEVEELTEELTEKYSTGKYKAINVLDKIESIFSIAAFVIGIFFAIYITKAYGLSGGYIAGMILLPTIFILIIGYGKSEYKGKYSMSEGKIQA